MKLMIPCMTCAIPEGKSPELTYVELKNEGAYVLTCPNGHKTLTILQEQKFELLFDSGALALLDGYTSEAVSSFSASLEIFFAFYVEIICLKNGISIEKIYQAQKQVNLAERKLGAFFLLYLLENKKVFASIQNDKTNLRNKVMHQGYIPTNQEVEEYGEYIFNIINALLREILKINAKYLWDAVRMHEKKARDGIKSGFHHTVIEAGVSTIISITRMSGENAAQSFQQGLKLLKNRSDTFKITKNND